MNYSKPEGSKQITKLCRQQLLGEPANNIPLKIAMHKLHPQAEIPIKENLNDIGWDISLVNRTENRPEDTLNEINDFGTGLSFSPPDGYHLEIIATNSLHRHGYMLCGPIIIDNTTRGELIVPLYKFRDIDDIELPFRAVRIIVRPTVYIHVSHQRKNPRQVSENYDQRNQPDMNTYQTQLRSNYPPGVPRPQAIPRGNHMF